MTKFHFPEPFMHDHQPIRNVNEILESQSTFGQRASDWVALNIGSWTFVIVQSLILTVWVILNITAYVRHWDPYPFILMNLVLSLQAAYTAPIIMMSQNRQSARDRLDAHNDYLINQKAEREVRTIMDHLTAQNAAISEIHQLLEDLQARNRSGSMADP
jgi:uncharacterized membrane protein